MFGPFTITGQIYLIPSGNGGGSPPGIWPAPGHPAHPIAPGGPPPGIWGPPGPWPTPPIYFPPGGGGFPPGGGGGPPPGIWGPPGPWPTPPIYFPPGGGGFPPSGGEKPPGGFPPYYPAFPIWGPPGAIFPPGPGYPPVVGGGPVYPPPPQFIPLPPNLEPPPDEPEALPDLASPGYWCAVIDASGQRPGFVQVAINTGPDHVPQPPTQGTPGEWIPVYGGVPPAVRNAWIPTPPSSGSSTRGAAPSGPPK